MRESRAPSIGPALIVVGLAAFVVIGGLGLSFAFGGSRPAASRPAGASGASVTAGLAAVPATQALSVVASNGQPPTDIGSTLVVPAGAALSSHLDQDAGLGQFDRSVVLAVAAAPSAVVAFYRAQMPRHGWGLLPGGAVKVGGRTELFYKRAGSDGYYWEVSVTVTAQSPSITPALGGGGQTAPTSRLELDLVQAGDAA